MRQDKGLNGNNRMKVWVVSGNWDHEGSDVLYVCISKEVALQFCGPECPAPSYYDCPDKCETNHNSHLIEEFEVLVPE